MSEIVHLTPYLERLKARLRSDEHQPWPDPEPVSITVACPVCRDTGRYTGWVEERDGTRTLYGHQPCPNPRCEAGQRVAAEEAQERIGRLFGGANITPRHKDACLESVKQPKSILDPAVKALAAGRSLYFWGQFGTGKTYLAVCLLKQALASGRAGYFAVVPDLLDHIRQGYGEGTADALLSAVETIDLLVLDDLGTEKPGDWALEKLYQIVNSRYLHERQTIITSNYTGKELRARGLDRIVSRIAEMCEVLHFQGADRRLGADL